MPLYELLKARPLAYNKYMPSRNTRKQYAEHSYYHIYTRGGNKQTVFIDSFDYAYFLGLFKRYLSKDTVKNTARIPYKNYSENIDLLAYCLMPNHIHIVIYQNDKDAISYFMQSVMTSYSMYFNKRYGHLGPVFQSRYLASIIDQENYLHHISRYIHLNPKQWRSYPYSSLPYYLGDKSADWIKPDKILDLFDNNTEKYRTFLKDYKEQKELLDELKWELANVEP